MQLVVFLLAAVVYDVGAQTDGTPKQQSPISLTRSLVKRVSWTHLKISGWNSTARANVNNNGETVKLTLDNIPKLNGKPLNGGYNLAQMHFHWGDEDSVGSEHNLLGKSYSSELHLVFYNAAYKSIKAAFGKPDGLAVMAFLFEAVDYNIKEHGPLVRALDKIVKVDSSTQIPCPNWMKKAANEQQTFLSYSGSTTTPPFSPALWIVATDPLQMSRKQLMKFRMLDGEEGGKIEDNFRDVQPVQDGLVVTAYKRLPSR